MAIQKASLLSDITTLAQTPRLWATAVDVGTFAVGTELLPVGSPLAFDVANEKWIPYTQPSDAAVYTITANATAATAGVFSLVIDGLEVVLAYNVTAAALQTEVNATLLDAERPYTVAAVATTGANLGAGSAVITITFSENAGAPSVDADMGGLTGNAHVLAAVDAGTQLSGSNQILGFVYESPVQLDDTDNVLGIVLVRGEVYASDVNTTALRSVMRGSPSEAEVKSALKSMALGDRIKVRGLVGAV